MLQTTPVPAFRDNYIWLVHGRADASRVAIVDPGDAAPVLEHLELSGLTADAILVTHHHGDHQGGVWELKARFGVPVYGPARERIRPIDHRLSAGDRVELAGLDLAFDVIEVPGHTSGHIAYVGHGAIFCGDTLFSAGCGRLFEGTPEVMTQSLDIIKMLPDTTRVFCAHEYSLSNLRFASAVEPANEDIASYTAVAKEARAQGRPTLPSTLGLEKKINPFLRCDTPTVRAAAERHHGGPLGTTTDVFAAIRSWKDGFA